MNHNFDSRSGAFVSAAVRGLLAQANGGAGRLTGDARDFARTTIRDLARQCVSRSGGSPGGSAQELIRNALTTSDFPSILENVFSKSLRDRYELAPRTFLELGRQAVLPDYKEVSRPQLGEAPQLARVLEGGEYTYGTVGDAAEKYSLAKYGRAITISREALINDDLDSLTRLPAAMGAAAAQLESDVFWTHVTGNPAMYDGTTLFHADHGNLAGSGTAMSIESIGAGRAAMRKQKGLGGDLLINVAPSFLVVPAALETPAEQFVATNLSPATAGAVNPFAGRLRVISEPRLDDDSATAWYLWADPALVDTIEYAYLAGEEGPQVEQKAGFDVDGLQLKVRHNFAVKAIDWRGLYKNPGA